MSNEPIIQVDMFINQNNVAGSHYFEVRNPGRLNEVVARVAAGSAAHVHDAVTAAHAAFGAWRETPVKERVERMLLAAATLENRPCLRNPFCRASDSKMAKP
jgi:acyl-CoA reductase-like NAD-dependent aldehyde dehydrogenase